MRAPWICWNVRFMAIQWAWIRPAFGNRANSEGQAWSGTDHSPHQATTDELVRDLRHVLLVWVVLGTGFIAKLDPHIKLPETNWLGTRVMCYLSESFLGQSSLLNLIPDSIRLNPHFQSYRFKLRRLSQAFPVREWSRQVPYSFWPPCAGSDWSLLHLSSQGPCIGSCLMKINREGKLQTRMKSSTYRANWTKWECDWYM